MGYILSCQWEHGWNLFAVAGIVLMISGPVYKGIEAISKGAFRITILAECREDNYRSVQRSLNREIRLLIDRKEIPLS